MSPSIARSLSTILGWVLAMVGIAVAFFQTSALFARFASPDALFGLWPYLGAAMIEGAILWAGLLLMSKSQGMVGGVGVLIFVVNVALSGMAQVIEALLNQGVELPPELGLAIQYILPASVVVIAGMLWLSEIIKSRQMNEGEWWGDSEAQPQVKLLPEAREGSEVEAVGVDAMEGAQVMSASSDIGEPVVSTNNGALTLAELSALPTRQKNKILRDAGLLKKAARRKV